MKKSSLLKMKNLPATEEMLAVAREDVPVKVGSGWNTSYRCRYSGFVRSAVLFRVLVPVVRSLYLQRRKQDSTESVCLELGLEMLSLSSKMNWIL